ncbi:MAG TPA: hypothetical protein VHC44_17185 [Verrucomicrobiae bacterium]|nr:hypothetical protein [Verrucomicrobiae bacterium]
MKSTKKRIDLNWNKLVGFNQVSSVQSGATKQAVKAALGAKIGGKVGTKGGGGGGGVA